MRSAFRTPSGAPRHSSVRPTWREGVSPCFLWRKGKNSHHTARMGAVNSTRAVALSAREGLEKNGGIRSHGMHWAATFARSDGPVHASTARRRVSSAPIQFAVRAVEIVVEGPPFLLGETVAPVVPLHAPLRGRPTPRRRLLALRAARILGCASAAVPRGRSPGVRSRKQQHRQHCRFHRMIEPLAMPPVQPATYYIKPRARCDASPLDSRASDARVDQAAPALVGACRTCVTNGYRAAGAQQRFTAAAAPDIAVPL